MQQSPDEGIFVICFWSKVKSHFQEHKLAAAKRIVPEWVGYDDEIRELLSGNLSKKTEIPEKSQKISDEL